MNYHRCHKRVTDPDKPPCFASRLEQLMIDLDLPNREFVKPLYLDERVISYWLHGDREPKISALTDICNAYNVSADWLLGLSDRKER